MRGVRGEELTSPTCFSVGEYTVKVTNLAGRGMAAAGLGMPVWQKKSVCAHILHGVSWSLSLNPYMEGPA